MLKTTAAAKKLNVMRQRKTFKKWTIEMDKYVIENYFNGDLEKVCSFLGVTKSAVMTRASHLKVKRRRWTEGEDKYVRENYPLGNTKKIREFLNVTEYSLISRARHLKVKAKEQNLEKLKGLYEDTNINFYWYGFIMADGYLSNKGELVVSANIKDYNHLKKLSTLLKVKLRTNTVITAWGTSYMCNLSCRDGRYGKLLKQKLNITTKKTYNPPNLSFLTNKEQFLSFFSGFIDGDGSFCYNKNKIKYSLRIEVHGNWIVNFQFFQEKLKEYFSIKSTVKINKKGYATLTISKISDIEKISNLVKLLNLTVLERKWNK